MSSPTPYEERQTELNSHRAADRDRAAEVAYSQLRQRGIHLDGSEPSDSDDLATLLSAVERFEEVISALGADRMTNSLGSDDPDDSALVLPQRRADESLSEYAGRVSEAAVRLGGG